MVLREHERCAVLPGDESVHGLRLPDDELVNLRDDSWRGVSKPEVNALEEYEWHRERVQLQVRLLRHEDTPARSVAVVCHYGVIRHLTGHTASNGDCVVCELLPASSRSRFPLRILERHPCPL